MTNHLKCHDCSGFIQKDSLTKGRCPICDEHYRSGRMQVAEDELRKAKSLLKGAQWNIDNALEYLRGI